MTPHNCDANEKIRITQKTVLAFTMSSTASQSLLGAVGRIYRTCTAQLAENSRAILFALLAFCTSSTSAMADQTIYAAPDGGIIFLGGIGYTWLKANEFVLDEAGHHISQLIWETQAPALTTGFKAEMDDRWTMSANAVIALSGNGYMEDYDWGLDLKNIEEPPDNVNFNWDHWSELSVHPDTRLDRYINVDIAVGHDFPIDNATTLNLHGGFKYTNIKWTAYGGWGVYSYGGFRNWPVSWPPGQPGISYEQRFPGVFLGAEITTKLSDWTLSGLLRGGRMVHPEADDYHWGGGLFEDRFSSIDFISLGAKANYQVAESVSIFLAADFDRYLRERGDTTTFDAKGAHLDKGSAGMDFYAVTTSVGFKFKF